MMMAIPEDEWRVFSRMQPAEMVATLREFAPQGRLAAYRQSPRGRQKSTRNEQVPPNPPMSRLPEFSGSTKSMQRHLNRAGAETYCLFDLLDDFIEDYTQPGRRDVQITRRLSIKNHLTSSLTGCCR
jgi:hypothetical protein